VLSTALRSLLFPYTTLFRSHGEDSLCGGAAVRPRLVAGRVVVRLGKRGADGRTGWGRCRIRPGPVPRSSGGAAGREADRSKAPPMVPTRHSRGHGRIGAGRRGPRGKRSPAATGPARTDRPVRAGRAGSRRGADGASPARSSNGPAGRSRPARAVTGRSRSAPTAPPDLHGDELLMTSRGRLGENASGQGPDGV